MNHSAFLRYIGVGVLAAAFSVMPALAQNADKDGDGVPNDLDDCPYTTAGAKVDRQGCALDEDFDGVADGLDTCPGSALGAVVNADGCASLVQAPAVVPTPAPAVVAEPAAPTPVPAPVVKVPEPMAVVPPIPRTAPPAVVEKPAPVVVEKPSAVDPFSTRPADVEAVTAPAPLVIPEPLPLPAPPVAFEPAGTAEIFTYGADQAPAPDQVKTGSVRVPAVKAPPKVPDQVKAALAAPKGGPAVVQLPKRRVVAPVPAPITRVPLPVAVAPVPAPRPAVVAAPAVVEPVAVSGPVFVNGRKISTGPAVPRGVTVQTPAPRSPLPSPVAKPPVTETVASAIWTVRLARADEIGDAGAGALNEIAGRIKQSQRDNPFLKYEVAGADSAARLVRSYLVAQGVASDRIVTRMGGSSNQVEVRPAAE